MLTAAAFGTTTEERIVRVGFPMQGGLSNKDQYGNYSGYTYDYLQEIAQFTGWEYEFIEVPGDINESLSAMLEMVSAGELDLLGGLMKNTQTMQLFDFPEYGYGFSYTTLNVLENNSAINENNYPTVHGLRIAILENAVRSREKLEAFCAVNNLDYTLVECTGDAQELHEAVRNGRADAMVGSSLDVPDGFRSIAQFDGNQYYFATTKGNTEIINELNRTILTIQQVKPFFDAQLYDKYFGNHTDQIRLSKEAESYIRTADSLRIAMVAELPPIQSADDSGAPWGIARDLLDRVQRETGLCFTYVMAGSYDDALRMLDTGEADAICGIPYDYQLAQEHDLLMSSAFLTAQTVRVSRGGQEKDGKTIGVISGLMLSPGVQTGAVRTYDTLSRCLDAVVSGEVDSAYINLYSAEYISHFSKYEHLRFIPQSALTMDFCVGIRKPANTMLVSIINTVLSSIPSSDLESIVYQNASIQEEKLTLSMFVEENPLLSVGIISGFFAIIVAVGLLMLRQRIRASHRLDVENQRYLQLSRLANEYIYEYDSRRDTLTLSQAFCSLFSMPAKVSNFMAVMQSEAPGSGLNPHIFQLFHQLMESSADTEGEYLCTLPSGEQRWYRGTQAEIADQDGGLLYVIGKLTDIQTEREEKEHLEHQVLTDGLTGVYNAVASRRLIGERLESLRGPAALLILDIDYFKEVNDQLGHYTGDVALKELAQMLLESGGQWDIVGRLGGDEFLIFLDAIGNVALVETFCQQLCQKATRTYHNGASSRTTTISIGAALVRRPCSFEELYQVVDRALYQSKEKGRNCWTVVEHLAQETV